MRLKLERIYSCSTYTIGHLYIDGEYFCDTIEDADRGLDENMDIDTIMDLKIYCETAIPTGTYKITMNVKSPKFSQKKYYKDFCDGYLPRLLDVKGYDGILIHGNFMERSNVNGDTANQNATCGCLIVGKNTIKGKVTKCRQYFEDLMNNYLIPSNDRNEEIVIEIIRKY